MATIRLILPYPPKTLNPKPCLLNSLSSMQVLAAVAAEAAEATVIQIAHRLHSVVGSDRIVVMEKGKAVEIGPPAQLLNEQDSTFSRMIEATGPATSQMLRTKILGSEAV